MSNPSKITILKHGAANFDYTDISIHTYLLRILFNICNAVVINCKVYNTPLKTMLFFL